MYENKCHIFYWLGKVPESIFKIKKQHYSGMIFANIGFMSVAL